jgi:acyl-CoA synthetase (AMP-forming)/AMP-acid ligase II
VLPGPRLDPASLFELMEVESVTFAAAVPTVWLSFLDYLRKNKLRPSTLRRVLAGGAAVPASVISGFEQEYGIEVAHLWGMTELSPVGTASRRHPQVMALPLEERTTLRLKQGRCPVGVDLEIKDDSGRAVAHDGRTCGHLVVRGRTVAARYFRHDEVSIADEAGYFDTGDIATIDERGYVQITDRAKDLIKSGGEWISSLTIENIAFSHPKVALAAVIALPHVRWGERPLLVVELHAGESVTQDELLQHLQGKLPRWWMPDEVIFIERMPLGATGKIDKSSLRWHVASREPRSE